MSRDLSADWEAAWAAEEGMGMTRIPKDYEEEDEEDDDVEEERGRREQQQQQQQQGRTRRRPPPQHLHHHGSLSDSFSSSSDDDELSISSGSRQIEQGSAAASGAGVGELDPAFLQPSGRGDASGPPTAASREEEREYDDDEEEDEKEGEYLEDGYGGEDRRLSSTCLLPPRSSSPPPPPPPPPPLSVGVEKAMGRTRALQSNNGQQPPLTVLCRVRPFLAHERHSGGKSVVSVSSMCRMVIANPEVFSASPHVVVGVAAAVNRLPKEEGGGLHCAEDWARAFEFDRCFWSVRPSDGHYVGQADLYRQMGRDLVLQAVVHEVDVALVVYGASQTGKSYSLFGPDQAVSDRSRGPSSDELGLMPRALISALEHLRPGSSLSLSCLEVNGQAENNGLRDLLLPPPSNTGRRHMTHPPPPPQLRVREHPDAGPFVENLIVTPVTSPHKLQQLLAMVRRGMRAAEGPAHTLVTAYIDHDGRVTRMQFVELAGADTAAASSSSAAPTGSLHRRRLSSPARIDAALPGSPTRPSPNQRSPAHTITLLRGLLASLRQQRDPSVHPPPTPRSCPLTWLLSRCLQDDDPSRERSMSRAYLLLCVSPSSGSYWDTLSTLKFGEDVCGGPTTESSPWSPSHLLRGREQAEGPTSSPPRSRIGSPVRDEDVADWRLLADAGEDDNQPPSLFRELASDRESARKVLKETVQDPQQRLAKLQRALQKPTPERPTGSRHNGTQTHLAGPDVVSRSSVPSSEQVWMLQAKAHQLELDLQSLRLDRDVALSEARSAQEELKRVRGRDMGLLQDKIRELETHLSVADEERERVEQVAKTVQGERDYVRQLLEEAKARHVKELQARESRLAELEETMRKQTQTPARGSSKAASGGGGGSGATSPSPAVLAEMEGLKSRLSRSEVECQELRGLLWDAKTSGAEAEQAKAEVERAKAVVLEELEATRAKLHQQTRALIALKQQQKPEPPAMARRPEEEQAEGGSAAVAHRPPPSGGRRRVSFEHDNPLVMAALIPTTLPPPYRKSPPPPPVEEKAGDAGRRRSTSLPIPEEGEEASEVEAVQAPLPPPPPPPPLAALTLVDTSRDDLEQGGTRDRRLEMELTQAREAMRVKDSLILQQSQEARTLAETLQRRVEALERVAGLEGQALKDGLRREARKLSRELKGWTGRTSYDHQRSSSDDTLQAVAAGLNNHLHHQQQQQQQQQAPASIAPPKASAPAATADHSTSHQAVRAASQLAVLAAQQAGSPTTINNNAQAGGGGVVASLQAAVKALIEDNARLEESIHASDLRAAKAMEEALVEVLLGLKDDNDRVERAVVALDQDKARAERQVSQLQEKLKTSMDYRQLFRRELAALWVAVNGDQALQSGHKRQAAEEGEEETAAVAGSQRHHHMNRGPESRSVTVDQAPAGRGVAHRHHSPSPTRQQHTPTTTAAKPNTKPQVHAYHTPPKNARSRSPSPPPPPHNTQQQHKQQQPQQKRQPKQEPLRRYGDIHQQRYVREERSVSPQPMPRQEEEEDDGRWMEQAVQEEIDHALHSLLASRGLSSRVTPPPPVSTDRQQPQHAGKRRRQAAPASYGGALPVHYSSRPTGLGGGAASHHPQHAPTASLVQGRVDGPWPTGSQQRPTPSVLSDDGRGAGSMASRCSCAACPRCKLGGDGGVEQGRRGSTASSMGGGGGGHHGGYASTTLSFERRTEGVREEIMERRRSSLASSLTGSRGGGRPGPHGQQLYHSNQYEHDLARAFVEPPAMIIANPYYR